MRATPCPVIKTAPLPTTSSIRCKVKYNIRENYINLGDATQRARHGERRLRQGDPQGLFNTVEYCARTGKEVMSGISMHRQRDGTQISTVTLMIKSSAQRPDQHSDTLWRRF